MSILQLNYTVLIVFLAINLSSMQKNNQNKKWKTFSKMSVFVDFLFLATDLKRSIFKTKIHNG